MVERRNKAEASRQKKEKRAKSRQANAAKGANTEQGRAPERSPESATAALARTPTPESVTFQQLLR